MALSTGTSRRLKLTLLSATLLSGIAAAGATLAQEAAPAPASDDTTIVVVTGYRGSLQNSTKAKKRAVGFEDSIYAEDMGKFPDTNLAESFNRIPGINIQREITGEGTTVAIRGLGSSFTRVLLNGAPVSVASTGDVNTNNSNREVDLDSFPPELFTQLTVSKSSSASQVEGGTTGVVNMRQARPFDISGDKIQFSAATGKNNLSDDPTYKGSLLISKKFGNFGILGGIAYQRSAINVEGYETVGWTNANLNAAMNPASTRNNTGGGNWTIPNTVPSNAGNGLTPGATIDQALLLAINPGATIQQIDNGIIPRLGRPVHYFGTRERTSGILSFEYRPSDSLRFWLDMMATKKDNDQQRTDMNFVGRNGTAIPLNMKFDRTDCSNGCVVTDATFANAQYFLEYRPFIESNTFQSFNPGMAWNISDTLKLTVDANYTKGEFRRDSPTVLVITKANSGVTATYTNHDGTPDFKANIDLNDPKNFQWEGGRLNMQSEARVTQTKGLHADLKWGDSTFNIQFGLAYDDMSRKITPYDNTGPWQNYTCGNNPSVNLPGPNGQPACKGEVITNTAAAQAAGYPAYPGYGTFFTQGQTTPITWGGSAIPQTALLNYLEAGPYGYINVNWDKFAQDSKYYDFLAQAPAVGGSNISSPRSFVREKVEGAYIQVNGDRDIFGSHRLRYDFGIRAVTTDQTIAGQTSFTDPRNTPVSGPAPADGGRYPAIVNFVYTSARYKNFLPSANFVLNVTDNIQARVAASTTMTRPNPSSMLPGLSFGDPSAAQGSVGNPSLQPYTSKNFDQGLEWYTGKEGYVALTHFNKKVTGFTATQNNSYAFSYLANYGVTYDSLNPTQQQALRTRCQCTDIATINNQTIILSQQVNASGELNIDGLEFAWVQPLGEWFPLLEGFGYSTNYTYIRQKGTGAAPAIALGVPKTTRNFTAFYERYGYSIRISDTYRDGSQASGVNQNGIANAALFNEKYEQVDLAASVSLKDAFGFSRDLDLTLDATNILGETMTQNFQFDGAPMWYYDPGTTVMVGLRGKF